MSTHGRTVQYFHDLTLILATAHH